MYNAHFNTMYMTFFHCLMMTLSPYFSGSIFMRIYVRNPSSLNMTAHSISVWRKDLGMSVVATSRYSVMSTTQDITWPYWITVGELVSFFFMQSCCLRPSQHPFYWMITSRFPLTEKGIQVRRVGIPYLGPLNHPF